MSRASWTRLAKNRLPAMQVPQRDEEAWVGDTQELWRGAQRPAFN